MHNKMRISLYLICLIRLISTYIGLSNFIVGLCWLYVPSVPIFLAAAYDERLVGLCLAGLIAVILLWVCAFVLGLLGIKFDKARKASVVAICVATAIDVFASFITTNSTIMLLCAIPSISLLAFGIFTLILHFRKNNIRQQTSI